MWAQSEIAYGEDEFDELDGPGGLDGFFTFPKLLNFPGIPISDLGRATRYPHKRSQTGGVNSQLFTAQICLYIPSSRHKLSKPTLNAYRVSRQYCDDAR